MKNKDERIWYSVIIAIVLVLLHSWQFYKSDFMIQPMINLTASLIYIPLVLIFGLKSLPIFLMCYGFVYIPFESFDNYTSLLLILSAISLDKRLKDCIWIYVLETISCYIGKGWEISHVTITICYIIFLWNVFTFIQDNHAINEPLLITKDEELILNQLLSGCEIKEVEGFSQNTVYKKLRDARERNKCITNAELLIRYKNNKK